MDLGYEAKFFLFPTTIISRRDGIRRGFEYLTSILPEEKVKQLVVDGSIKINPAIIDLEDRSYDAFIYNLLHEPKSILKHKRDHFILNINLNTSEIDRDYKNLLYKLENDFELIKINSKDYLERYAQFINYIASKFPTKEHYVIKRIKNDCIHEKSKSYLIGWDELQHQADKFYSEISKKTNVSIIPIEDVLTEHIDKHGLLKTFPCRIEKTIVNKRYEHTTCYDLEHPSRSFWNNVFNKIFDKHPNAIAQGPSHEENRVILANQLIQSIIKNDVQHFNQQIVMLSLAEIESHITILEDAICLMSDTICRPLEKVLQNALLKSNSFPHGVRNRIDSLISICSGEKDFEKKLQNKQIALWGAGGRCESLLENIASTCSIVCIFDSNPDKHGTFLSGIPIVNFEGLSPYDYDIDLIVVTSTYFSEISAQISGYSALKDKPILNSNDFLLQSIKGATTNLTSP